MKNNYEHINNPFKNAVQEIEGIIMKLQNSGQEYDIPAVREVLEQLLNGTIASPSEAMKMAEDIAKPPITPDSEYSM